MSEKHVSAAKLRGKARSVEIWNKVSNAMELITEEIKVNGGIYPLKNGSLSKSEVSRRAGICESTLFTPTQKALNEKVDAWLEIVRRKEVSGITKSTKLHREIFGDWKEKYDALQTTHIVTELEIQSIRSALDETVKERDQALREISQLREENTGLRKQILNAGLPLAELVKS